ncbi:MAG TPA: non-ribosomal peptide synthetase [Steroidobacteraceae bacterium]|jgi:acyl-CoA synthetase (AMP-forming)/AMP-acid ligase II/thioesterase domain-containing protein/acyl carrier protein
MSLTSAPLASDAKAKAVECAADFLLNAAGHHRTSGVYVSHDDDERQATFSPYPMLLDEARRILGGLKEVGLKSGARVALLLERPMDFLPAFWACILGGFIPCPLAAIRNDEERWGKHLAHVDALLGRPLFIGTGDSLTELLGAINSVTSVRLDLLRTSEPSDEIHQAAPSDAALLMLTSGSTGNAKAVELTHANLAASLAARAERQRLSSADTMFNWIAFDHVAALLESHMIATYVGATQLHAQPAAVLSDPLRFLKLIHQYRVSIAFAPNFLLGQINSALRADGEERSARGGLALDLSCLRRIVTGGEANVVETSRNFLELLVPYGLARSTLWPAFGMTETCAASVYSHEFPDLDGSREFASVGLPLRGLEMRIAGDDGYAVGAGGVGELQLRGPMIFHRYYNNEEATRAAFTVDGWFRTGDVGCIEDGRLCLIARNKDSIIVSGVNYYSQELETRLEQLGGIERSFLAAFPSRPKGADTEQLVVAFATSIPLEDEEAIYNLMVAVRNTTVMLWGFRPALVLPLPMEVFPKTSLGKIQRSLMRKRFEAGAYKTYVANIDQIVTCQLGGYTAPQTSLETTVSEIFATVLGIEVATLSTTASFFDLGGTSLDILKLTRALNRRFGLSATLTTVLQQPAVRQLAACIASSVNQKARDYDPIVIMQRIGKGVPLFCVHPGNGSVLTFVNLAKYFVNERPFYALRPRGFDVGEECFRTFDEIVDTYYDAIRRSQPNGPYALLGYSIGGSIAFELAKRLVAGGCHVAFLGSINSWPLGRQPPQDFQNLALDLASDVLQLIDAKQVKELRELEQARRPDWNPCEDIIRIASRERLSQLDLDLARFSVWAEVARSLTTYFWAHTTSGTVNEMTVFYTDTYGEGGAEGADWSNQMRKWNEFVRSPRYIRVAGNHHTLMAPIHVAGFQSVLRGEIGLALRNQE